MRESYFELPRRFIVSLFVLVLALWTYSSSHPLLARGQDGSGFATEVEGSRAKGSYSGRGEHPSGGGDHDRDWQNLVFTGYVGPKIRVTLGDVEDRTSLSRPPSRSNNSNAESVPVPTGVIKERLSSVISNAQRFDVETSKDSSDRQARESMGELPAAEDSVVSAPEYLVSGLVTEWSLEADTTSASSEPIGEAVARAAIVFRIAEVATGQILFATEEQAEINLRSADRSTAEPSSPLIDERDTAFRSAIEACVNKGVYQLVDWFQRRPWTARVSRVEGDRVYVNAGRDHGLDVGMTLSLLANSRPIIDSETGSILGSATQRQGRMVIIDVGSDIAVAEIVEECEGIKPGDRVELRPSRS